MRHFLTLFAFAVGFMPLLPSYAAMLSVEDAYRAIPHKRTLYKAQLSSLSQADKAYLTELFRLTDQAMRLRVFLLQGLSRGDDIFASKVRKSYQVLSSQFEALKPPRKIAKAHKLVALAIDAQSQYLLGWVQLQERSPTAAYPEFRQDKRVLQAHRQLLEAYGILMKVYSKESPHNKTAFFDHLCALDFI